MAPEARIKISANTAQFHASMSRVHASLHGLLRNVRRMMGPIIGMTGGIVALGGAFYGLKKAIDEASTMEQLLISMSTLLKDGEKAKALMKDIVQFADITPFKTLEVAASVKALIGYGIAAEDTIEILRRVGDVASGLGQPLTEIIQLYGRNVAQGRLFARDINQFQNRGIPILRELAKQFQLIDPEIDYNSSDELRSKLAEANSQIFAMLKTGEIGTQNLEEAFRSLTQGGGQFANMMALQSQSYKGLMSTFKSYYDALFREFGTPLLDPVKALLREGASSMKAMQADARALGDSFAHVFKAFIAAFKQDRMSELISLTFAVAATKIGGILESELTRVLKVVFGENFPRIMLSIGSKLAAALYEMLGMPMDYVAGALMTLIKTAISTTNKFLSKIPGTGIKEQIDPIDNRIKEREKLIASWSNDWWDQAYSDNPKSSERADQIMAAIDQLKAENRTDRELKSLLLGEASFTENKNIATEARKEMQQFLNDMFKDFDKEVMGQLFSAGANDATMEKLKAMIDELAGEFDLMFDNVITPPKAEDTGGKTFSIPGTEEASSVADIVATSLAKIGGGGYVAQAPQSSLVAIAEKGNQILGSIDKKMSDLIEAYGGNELLYRT